MPSVEFYRGEIDFFCEYYSNCFGYYVDLCPNILCRNSILCCSLFVKVYKMWCSFVEKLCNILRESPWKSYVKVFCQWWKSLNLCCSCGKIEVLHSSVEKFCSLFYTYRKQIKIGSFAQFPQGLLRLLLIY